MQQQGKHTEWSVSLPFYRILVCQKKTDFLGVRVIVFKATFNNISAISCRSVLMVEETRVPGEKY
jgi:hypothetical protein